MEGRMLSWRYDEMLNCRAKVWKDTCVIYPGIVRDGILVGGHDFWAIEKDLHLEVDGYAWDETLISFDVCVETFNIISGPKDASWSSDDYYLSKRVVLLELNGV
ncbi:OLC1v1001144C1 [Oldenlandia corymbosa var. corymbosa]|uniref:OLC1v1001144C1 n=1 Tax=Oldenlandia corymbosa var. corymbosa TaxID=529605 RepID=A0AAV1D693_OLDCO|nr:OLC1v1001144C1 [Oldenlandia corymbosa var. corymbosa]